MFKIVPYKRLNARTIKASKQMPRRVKKGINNAFMAMQKELKPDAVESMKEAKSGLWYYTYLGRGGRKLKKRRLHRASKKGETPAILTGALAKSLGYRRRFGQQLTFGANTPYAKRHELGGRSYLLKMINKNERNMHRHLYREIENAIRGRGKK
jgi:phage gpG-like protein